MKKWIQTVGILAVLFMGAFVLNACNKNKDSDPTQVAHYTPDDFIKMQSFAVTNSDYPNTHAIYEKTGSQLNFYTAMPSGVENGQNEIYYVFTATQSKKYVNGSWQPIEQNDVPAYVDSLRKSTGLNYRNVKKDYIKQTNSHCYEIDQEHFFMQAFRGQYESYFGKDYAESDFKDAFAIAKEELYGNIDDYTITLDCSDPAQITLQISKPMKNDEQALAQTFVYSQIDSAKVELPDDKQ